MKTLDPIFLKQHPLSLEVSELLYKAGVYQGRQDLYTRQTPQVLETLKQAAIIQSTESSNRIEGITIEQDRLKAIVLKNSKPQNRSEAEIIGYKNVLSKIHHSFDRFELSSPLILDFHSQMLKGTGISSGQWKKKDNMIEEQLPNGRWVTRFVPVSARETAYYMKESCHLLKTSWKNERLNKLILIASFVFDFLCIHPFTDGNGRLSRLLTVLLLHQAGYEVTRFISLERIIEESKESYYRVLHESSQGWHEGRHRILPWWEYFLTVLVKAYEEFAGQVEELKQKRGSKTQLVLTAIEQLPTLFTLSDVERACPTVGRDMVRVVLNRLKSEKKVKCLGSGRNAEWRKL